MAVSNNNTVTISTYALGSCIGIAIYDPSARAGGMLHIMLPDSSLSPDKAKAHPYMFADTGLHHFFKSLQGVGVRRKTMHTLIAGGASVIQSKDIFHIGERNIKAVKAILTEHNINIRHEEVGGVTNRTLHLNNQTGIVEIKEPSGIRTFSLT